MSTVREICVIVKYSPKPENILGRMPENFEGNFGPDTEKFWAPEKLCPTRWTVRASCFQKIIGNYCLLLKLWDECLNESFDVETRSRITGCKLQIKTFNFFFVLYLGQRNYRMTDNLSKELQKEKMSAVSGQSLASLTAKTIQSMRNNSDFDLFYQTVNKKAEKIDDLDKPV